MTASLYHRADVSCVQEHINKGCNAEHPESGWGTGAGTPAVLRDARSGIFANGGTSQSRNALAKKHACRRSSPRWTIAMHCRPGGGITLSRALS